MAENGAEMRSLALTPTWSVASVLTVFVAVSLVVERSIHRLSNVSRNSAFLIFYHLSSESLIFMQIYQTKKTHLLLPIASNQRMSIVELLFVCNFFDDDDFRIGFFFVMMMNLDFHVIGFNLHVPFPFQRIFLPFFVFIAKLVQYVHCSINKLMKMNHFWSLF